MKRTHSFTKLTRPTLKESTSDDDLSATFEVALNLQKASMDKKVLSYDELNLEQLLSSELQDRIHFIRHNVNTFAFSRQESRHSLLEHLISQLQAERDKDTKALIVLLLEKLAHDPSIDCRIILESLLSQVHLDSTKLKCQTYGSILKVIRFKHLHQSNSITFIDTLKILGDLAIHELSDSHHRIRSISLQLLASLPPMIKRVEDINRQAGTSSILPKYLNEVEVQSIIHNYGNDTDPRVRRTALQALLQLHQRGCALDVNLYSLCTRSLKDDYEEVRFAALSLVWVLSSLYPSHSMRRSLGTSGQEHTTIPLVDDAFVKICDMVSDGSVNIRSKACTLMGSYREANEMILMQTFSKEIMTHLKRKNPRKGGGSKNKKQKYIPNPEGDFDVESDDFRLLDSGACGAFVRGLEDEFQEVRNAAIDSICELCMYNQKFSERARDFLVDMFHDEIDSVRLNAINSLRKIGTRFQISLDYELVQITLSVLDDADRSIREAIHGMLRVVRLSAPELVTNLVEVMLASMERYPEDQLSIFRCFGEFGKNHGDYIEHFVPRFFNLEQNFIPKELHADSIKHIGNLILSFNASVTNSAILKKLPKYAFRHYGYLRDKFPNCFPEIKVPIEIPRHAKTQLMAPGFEEGEILDSVMDASKIDIREFMEQTLGMIESANSLLQSGNLNGAMSLVKACSRDLRYIAHITPLLSGKAEFALIYLESLKILIEVKRNYQQKHFSMTCADLASSLLTHSYVMENTFLGVAGRARHFVIHLRVIANIVWLLGALNPTSQLSSLISTRKIIKLSMKRMITIQEQFEGDDFVSNDLVELLEALHRAFEEPTSMDIIPLFNYIKNYSIFEIDLSNVLKRSEAKILQTPATKIEYVAGFPLRIYVEAEVYNITDTSSVGIQVMLPDKTVHHYWTPPSHFVIVKPFHYLLRTHVEISLSVWTEPCSLSILIVRSFEPDIVHLDPYIMRQASNTRTNIAVDRLAQANTLALSREPLKLTIWPTETRH